MRKPTVRRVAFNARQSGGFLLEALVGILIFTLGVLGLVALQGRAIGYSSDAQIRGEAAYLAGSYISKMWADARGNLATRYIAAGQDQYDAFAAAVTAQLPGASLFPNNPEVSIVQPVAGSGTADARGDAGGITLTDGGTLVTVTIRWQMPGSDGGPPIPHNYTMSSIIAQN